MQTHPDIGLLLKSLLQDVNALLLEPRAFRPGLRMSSMTMVGDSLSVIIQGKNPARILIMSVHRQCSSPLSATYKNQAL